MLKKLSLAARIAIATCGIGYILWSINWYDKVDAAGQDMPGIGAMLRQANVGLLVIGLMVMGLVYPTQALRWFILLRAREIDTNWPRTFRLYMVGLFFNVCMPGTTGGDVVKGYYAVRHGDRRADALMTIVFDRLAGLLGLFVFAGLVGLTNFDNVLSRRIAITAWTVLLTLLVGYAIYSSRGLRKLLHTNRLKQIPWIGKLLGTLDTAAVAYRHHLVAVAAAIAISTATHFVLSVAMLLAGTALGMEAPLGMLLTVNPALVFAGGLPVSYQGIGVQEGVAKYLIEDPPHVTMNQIVGMLLLFRLYIVCYAVTGAFFLFRGDVRLRASSDRGTK